MDSPATQLAAAKTLVFEFAQAWSAWEAQMARTSPPFSDPALRAAHAALLTRYCTPRKRVYVDGSLSFSSQLTYGDVGESTLSHAELVGPRRAHLDFRCKWKTHRFVVRRTRAGWLLDGVKWRVLETGNWRTGLIGI